MSQPRPPRRFDERWRLSRAGIVNVWHYLDNEFDLSGGRMILRGTNGSGKSRALEMLLPFLLDADRRLKPQGAEFLAFRGMLDALAPAAHCELELDGCEIPATARIGDMADAYPAMALPFRDTEDTVGTANISGLLSWLLEQCAARIEPTEDNALRLGRIAGLVSLVQAASQLAVAALDGEGPEVPARVIGVRLLARQIVDEIRELLPQGASADEAITRALAAYDLLSSVAREPRKVRQARLGNSLWSVKQ